MINDKKSFFLGNLLGAGVVGMIVVACGSGGGDANTGVSGGANSVSARQVIFTDSSGNYIAYEKGRFVKVATTPGYIDTTTQVLARNVNLDTSNNTVTQPNLQDALDKQIALDLTKTLPGTTWVITNTGTPEYTYPNDPGNVTFNSDGSFTLNSGWFCAAGARTYSRSRTDDFAT